jgi:hypothetical protein
MKNKLDKILRQKGIKEAIRELSNHKYKDYCLFLADVAESVLNIFENECPNDKRPRKCIEGIRLYHAGKITKDKLNKLRQDAYSACNATYAASAAAYYAAYYATYADYAATYADYDIAYDIATSAAYAAGADYAATYAAGVGKREEKWKEIEKIFKRHFIKNHEIEDSLFKI